MHARREQDQVVRDPRIERQILNIAAVDDQVERGIAVSQQRSRPMNLQRFGDRSHLERKVQPHRLRDIQNDSCALCSFETGRFHANVVRADGQRGSKILAPVVRGEHPADASFRVDDPNSRLGHNRARWISQSPGQRSGDGLRVQAKRRHQQEGNRHNADAERRQVHRGPLFSSASKGDYITFAGETTVGRDSLGGSVMPITAIKCRRLLHDAKKTR